MTAAMDVDVAPLQVIALDKKDGYIWDHSGAGLQLTLRPLAVCRALTPLHCLYRSCRAAEEVPHCELHHYSTPR